MKLDVQNISVSIGSKEILQDISLQIEPKRFVGLIGPNGSGKSTLLKSIYRVLNPTSGSVMLDDIDLLSDKLKDISKVMSVVSQFNNIDFDFSVFDLVMMGRTPHKKAFELTSDEDRRIVNECLATVDLATYSERNISSLSGGEKQRVVFARALAQQPKCLILDEPTNHLDIKYQLKLLSSLKGLNLTIITVIHDLSLACKYCDYLYVLKSGRVVASGRPKEIITVKLMREVYEVDVDVLDIGEDILIRYK